MQTGAPESEVTKKAAFGLDRVSLVGLSVIWLSIAIFDATQRLWLSSSSSVGSEIVSKGSLFLPNPLLNDIQHSGYVKKLAGIMPDTAEIVSFAAAPSSGKYSSWASGSFNFRLIAIAKGKEVFAVFERFDAAANERTIIDLRVGSVFGEVTVKSIEKNVVVLDSPTGTKIELALFDPVGDRTGNTNE